jgi:hypothetical protein
MNCMHCSSASHRLLSQRTGNHDCLGSIRAQVAYANVSARLHRQPRWHLPSRYYTHHSQHAELFVLDTCSLFCALEPKLPRNDHCHIFPEQGDTAARAREAKEQERWLLKALSEPKKGCRIAVGHVPIYSAVLCESFVYVCGVGVGGWVGVGVWGARCVCVCGSTMCVWVGRRCVYTWWRHRGARPHTRMAHPTFRLIVRQTGTRRGSSAL